MEYSNIRQIIKGFDKLKVGSKITLKHWTRENNGIIDYIEEIVLLETDK